MLIYLDLENSISIVRLMNMIRLLRLLKLYKYIPYLTSKDENSAAAVIPAANSEEALLLKKYQSNHVGTAMSELTNKRYSFFFFLSFDC